MTLTFPNILDFFWPKRSDTQPGTFDRMGSFWREHKIEIFIGATMICGIALTVLCLPASLFVGSLIAVKIGAYVVFGVAIASAIAALGSGICGNQADHHTKLSPVKKTESKEMRKKTHLKQPTQEKEIEEKKAQQITKASYKGLHLTVLNLQKALGNYSDDINANCLPEERNLVADWKKQDTQTLEILKSKKLSIIDINNIKATYQNRLVAIQQKTQRLNKDFVDKYTPLVEKITRYNI